MLTAKQIQEAARKLRDIRALNHAGVSDQFLQVFSDEVRRHEEVSQVIADIKNQTTTTFDVDAPEINMLEAQALTQIKQVLSQYSWLTVPGNNGSYPYNSAGEPMLRKECTDMINTLNAILDNKPYWKNIPIKNIIINANEASTITHGLWLVKSISGTSLASHLIEIFNSEKNVQRDLKHLNIYIDVSDLPSSLLISSYINDFLNQMYSVLPEHFDKVDSIVWQTKFEFQNKNIRDWVEKFFPDNV